MMNIEDQVCSLELAKKLKNIGVKQESLFYFTKYVRNGIDWCDFEIIRKDQTNNYEYLLERTQGSYMSTSPFVEESCSAFTVAELMNCIPRKINDCDFEIIFIPRIHGNIFIDKPEIRYRTAHLQRSDPNYKYFHGVYDKNWNSNIGSSLAMMIIYLIENNHITIEGINNAIIS